jgi:ABC-2 type transport system ATP-binding protein
MGESDSIVRVEGLTKRYGAITAVQDLSFEIRRGEIFGLLGPNGAGKTTTISMIAGLLSPTSGEARVAGFDVRSAGAGRRRALGMVPQELAIYPRLSGRENVEFFGRLYGLRGAALRARADQMLALVGLSDRAWDRAEHYSGGMKRRLNLAAGLMHGPQLLLLDEPTVGVDPQSRNHIFEGVRELNRAGLTILYTSHYMEEVESLCDRVGIMDGGRLIACDTVPNLIAGMGGAVIEIGIGDAQAAGELTAAICASGHVQAVETVPAPGLEGVTIPPIEPEHVASQFLHVRAAHPSLALPGIVAAVNASGAPLVSLTIKQPDLEDVFLSLTGKTLRD